MSKNNVFGLTLVELEEVALQLSLPKYVGKQLAQWLYQKRVTSFESMTNLSLKAREMLSQHYTIGRIPPSAQAVSQDGTVKYLFPCALTLQSTASVAQAVETVYMPEEDRATLCVSTQAGCKMRCAFCMTGTLGFHGNLTAADILNQIYSIPQSETLTNLVFMGEGEPMDNLDQVLKAITIITAPYGLGFSPKRITVSSVGITPQIKHFLDSCECHLAISLHNPFALERQDIMPTEKAYPIEHTVAMLKTYFGTQSQRRLSFEYICWGGVNDDIRHAKALVKLLSGLTCRVNLIRFHQGVDAINGNLFKPSDEIRMIAFRDYLTRHGITTTIRRSRGEDILAACGQLINQLAS